MTWTEDDARRARELLAAAVWGVANAALIVAAPDLLERALGEIERLRQQAEADLEAMSAFSNSEWEARTERDGLRAQLAEHGDCGEVTSRVIGERNAARARAAELERVWCEAHDDEPRGGPCPHCAAVRIATLEAALRQYGRHFVGCPVTSGPVPNGSGGWEPGFISECHCGFDAALAGGKVNP